MTYSIVARDSETGMLGVGIESHFFATGSVAPFAQAGVGAVSTQAFASRQYGALGLELLGAEIASDAVLEALLKLDTHPEIRQVGLVDAQGRAAAFTGKRCVQHASHYCAPGVSAQGNMLAAPHIPEAMVEAYRLAKGDFADRILAALDRAQSLGGDARGVQSAALLVVGARRDGSPWNGIVHDERVDDSSNPLAELRRLVGLRREYRSMAAVLFENGPLFEDVTRTAPGDLVHALEVLRRSGVALGTSNYEATLWQAVLMARHGRLNEAKALLDPLLRRQSTLVVFIEGLAAAGIIEPATAYYLLDASLATK